jgi:predicted porin
VGATALAAVSAQAADPISITTFGWVNELMGVATVDESGAGEDFNFAGAHLDGQVNFKGATTLDNGIEVGVRLEIEMPNPGSLDETFVWLKGDFGELRAGNHNSAGYSMISGVPQVGLPINSGWISDFIPVVKGYNDQFRATGMSSKIDGVNDDNTVLYFSPRFSGFQLGLSYTPNVAKANQKAGVTDTNKEDYYNGFGVGATFVESFNGFDVNLGGSYFRADAGDKTTSLGGDDIEQVQFSVNVGVSGFSIGGAYANQLEGRLGSTDTVSDTVFANLISACVPTCTTAQGKTATTGATSTKLSSNEGESWALGAAYATGPWTVAVNYFHGETEDDPAIAGDDELDAIAGGVSYALGPGITTDFTVFWAETEDEAGASQDGWAGVIGISVGF